MMFDSRQWQEFFSSKPHPDQLWNLASLISRGFLVFSGLKSLKHEAVS